MRNFRNLSEQVVYFDPKITVVVGDNNQGKTNLLEAIYCAVSGKAIRGEQFSDLLALGAESGALAVEINDMQDGELRVYREFDRTSSRKPTLSNEFISQKKVDGRIVPVYWSADIIRSFQESGDSRRDLLDQMSTTFVPNYEILKRRYSRLLNQRNAALKNRSESAVMLYTSPLIECSYQITVAREAALNAVFDRINLLLPELPELGFSKLSPELILKRVNRLEYLESMRSILVENFQKELILGYTITGAHRDDFDVKHEDRSVIQFFSRGIARSIAILIHLVVLEGRKSPYLVLIDDAFCEIAEALKLSLQTAVISRFQTVYVTTDRGDSRRLGLDGHWIMLNGGCVYGKT